MRTLNVSTVLKICYSLYLFIKYIDWIRYIFFNLTGFHKSMHYYYISQEKSSYTQLSIEKCNIWYIIFINLYQV